MEEEKVVQRLCLESSDAAAAVGPYNQAVIVNGSTMYISGTMGIDPNTNQLVGGGTVAEAVMALTNIGNLLKAAGASFNNVVKVTVLMADMDDFADVNEVYKKFFTRNYPARAAYQVAALPKGARVEIEAIAMLGAVEDFEMF